MDTQEERRGWDELGLTHIYMFIIDTVYKADNYVAQRITQCSVVT